MNATQTLTFLWTSWSLIASLIIVAVVAVLCWVAWRRSDYRRDIGALELLRFVLVCGAAILFNQPEWIQEFRPSEKPTIAVLWDDSASMKTRDVSPSRTDVADPADPKSPLTRRQSIETLLTESSWSDLQDRFQIVIEPFSSTADRQGSNLYEALDGAAKKFNHLQALVLASDGDWNEGPPPVDAAARLRLKGIPAFTIPVGSPTRLPDIELLSLDAPTFGVAGKTVRIPFTIESSLPRDYMATVLLKTSDGRQETKEVRIAAMSRTTDAIEWKAEEIGQYTLTLTVPAHADETILDNNSLTAPIAIRQEKLRVLVVETYPRWEYRYLRNALSRDPGVEVSCLLFHPGLTKRGGGNQDYIQQFPEGLEGLSPYDVVFLGDVGVEDGQLTAEQCRLLKGLVEQQASGLVFMPGWQGRQFSLLDTELSELYPVVLDEAQPGGWGSRTPNHFELTELGRRSLLTKLADTQDDNIQVWESLPGFQWYAPVLRSRPGSDVLCVHKDIANQYGRVPLLATRTFGAGKVLFMGTDGAWRWRKGVEDKYHYRFWGQVVRWMAYQRNMAKGETMRLYYTPDQPQLRQTISLRANVMEPGGEPLHQGDVVARIVAPSGKAETARFLSVGDEWGAFSARYVAEEPGKHEVTLTCKQTKATLEASFFVQGDVAERVGKPARPEVLEEIARVTQGRTTQVDKLPDLLKALATLPEPPTSVRRLQFWSHPLVAGLLVALLGVFWVGRKVVGLV